MATIPRSPSLFLNLTSLLLLLLLPSVSWAASSSDSTLNSFAQCLNNYSLVFYSKNNPSFPTIFQAYVRNTRLDTPTTPKPQIIVTPLTELQASAAVKCAGKTATHLVPRSGGHDYEGLSYFSGEDLPFAILDLFNLRSITVDVATESAWVQSGAILGELYYAIWNATESSSSEPYGYPAGMCSTVGVGGHISGAGYGNMLRKYGLSVDNVIDARVVNADGEIMDRKSMGEDFFWALRGGGAGSFGVLLAYKIKIVRVPETVTVFRIEKTLDQNATLSVRDYLLMANKTDEDLFIRLLIQPITRNKTQTIRASFLALFLGGADKLVEVMDRDFPTLGLKKEDCNEASWIRSVLWWANFELDSPINVLLNRTPDSVTYLKRKSDYLVAPIGITSLENLWTKMMELGKIGLVFNPYGGKMDSFPSSATPFPHRAGILAKVQYSVNWDVKDGGESATAGFLNQARELYEYTEPMMSKNPRSAYLNYRDLEIGSNPYGKASYEEAKVYGEKYFGGNYDRLVKVKSTVDPTNMFWNQQSIPAAVSNKGSGRRFR